MDSIGIAVSQTVFHPDAAAPHDRSLSSVIPYNPAVDVPAFGTIHNAGQCILAAINTFLSVLTAAEIGSSHHLFLHLHIKIAGNNGFVAVFYIILWHQAIIWNTLFLQEIHRVGLLKKGISNIFFVFEDFLQGFCPPFLFPGTRQNTIRF